MPITTTTFTTASVPASDSVEHNQVIASSNIHIYKIKVVPSIIGGTSKVQLYEKDTFQVADLVYGSNSFAGTYFDPIQKDSAGVITEAERGYLVPYDDDDATTEIHMKILNDDSQAKTYDVTVQWEAR